MSTETGQEQVDRDKSFQSSISESLAQLAAACQHLADLAAEAAAITILTNPEVKDDQRVDEQIQQDIAEIFRPDLIPGYNRTKSMEEARVAYLNAAVEMYKVMADDTE